MTVYSTGKMSNLSDINARRSPSPESVNWSERSSSPGPGNGNWYEDNDSVELEDDTASQRPFPDNESDNNNNNNDSMSQLSAASTTNYELTVATQDDDEPENDRENDTCGNFYIIATKWIVAILIAIMVLACVTANKLCLLVIGREYSIPSTIVPTNSTSGSNGNKDAKRESIVIMLTIILMVPQAISLLAAIWGKRKSQPWPRHSAVLWIIVGGFIEASCLSYLCIYATTVLGKHPEVFLLFLSGLFLVPTIIQVYQSARKFHSKDGKTRIALFVVAAGLQITGFTLLFLQKEMPGLQNKIGIPVSIGLLSIAWSPKLRRLQTKAVVTSSREQVSPRPGRSASMGDSSSLGDFETNNGTQDSRFSTNVPGKPLKHSAREKAALVMSLVQLLTTPVACIVLCLVGKVADLEMFGDGFRQITVSHPVFYYFLVQLFVTFLGYHAAWLACSMYAQRLAFALPLTLATPLALVFIEVNQLCNTWLIPLPCGPDLPMYYLIGITALLLLGQFLSTGYYVWANKGYIMGKASHLFWLPSYTGALLEPFLLLNRRNKVTDDSHVTYKQLTRNTYVFICSTMYHEELYEMEQLLRSLHDVDNNFKRAKRHVESHIFFDGSIKADVMSIYVLQLATIIKKTLKVDLSEARKIRTPYGMQLSWLLPGDLPITIHMKDNSKVKNKKRWSQVMYMSYVLDYRQRLLKVDDDEAFILTTDADVYFTHESMEALIDYMVQDNKIGAVCGRTHPMGNGPLVWYQIFDYAIGHWFMKVANHVFGSVLCCPGCFSLYRCKAVRDVLKEYATNVNEAFEFLTKDMGEDRWFCTLMVEAGWRLAYCAAAEDRTYCPQEFEEFYKQRRRWMPSTLANLSLLVSKWRMVLANNENISFAFIIYQVVLLMATLIGPSIVILFIVGGLVSLGGINEDVLVILLSILTIGYAIICLFFSQGTREGKNTNTAIGQNENPLVTLWKLLKSKCACCFQNCQEKAKTPSNSKKLSSLISQTFTDSQGDPKKPVESDNGSSIRHDDSGKSIIAITVANYGSVHYNDDRTGKFTSFGSKLPKCADQHDSSMAFVCDLCNKSFTQETNLVRHKKAIHSGRSFNCERCGNSFNRRDVLKRHMKKHSQDKEHKCQHCERKFYRKDMRDDHQKVCEYEKMYEDQNKKRKLIDEEHEETPEKRPKLDNASDQAVNKEPCDNEDPCELTSAMQDSLKTFKFKPRIAEKYDLRLCLQGKKKALLNRLQRELKSKRGIKWFVSVQVKFIKPKANGIDVVSEPHFRSLCMTTVNPEEVEEQLNEVNQKILNVFATYQREVCYNLFEIVKELPHKARNPMIVSLKTYGKRVNVKLITNPTKLIKLTASPAFDSFRIFSEDLAAVNMKKTKLYLNRPIYVGFSILDLSKVLMYNFHFKYMVPKYGTQSKLLFTDTDSLCYDVKTDDLYRDFHQDLDYFDTSEYPTDHFLYCARNKKVLGKMKDETHGIPIQEFIGLRPKMYSILFTENNKQVEKKTAKGISKNVTKQMIRHQDYKS
ncbi:hypothetical protein QZH41_016392 [Actinostola sp. cb2023]|nr:hypothetical protein QZH41_016392 [Actinostola sp. cb2023]